MATKRNPQDVTLRNTRAANKKLDALTVEVTFLKQRVESLEKQMKEMLRLTTGLVRLGR